MNPWAEKSQYILLGVSQEERATVSLKLGDQLIIRSPTRQVRILGVPFHENGGAAAWLKELAPTWMKILLLIRGFPIAVGVRV